MPRLDRLPEAQARGLLSHNCLDHDDAPWTPLAKPLAAARLALVTTAGLHLRGDAPFTGGHQGYRTIPSATPPRDIVQSHTSIGFDRTGLLQDLNGACPVDRARDLVAAGELGSLAIGSAAGRFPSGTSSSAMSGRIAITFVGGAAYDSTGDNKVGKKESPKVRTMSGAGRATAPFLVDQHLAFAAGNKIELLGDPNDFDNGVGDVGVRILSWRDIR